jgi:hypothetical protein
MRIIVKGELLYDGKKRDGLRFLCLGIILIMILGLLNGLAWVLEIISLLRLMRIERRARSIMSRSVV